MKKVLLTSIAFATLIGCKPKTELHVYSWSDYIDPEIVNQFEKDNDCKLIIDTFDSNETMYAKLKAGATGYDIAIPTSYQITTMVKEDMLLKLDKSKIPNVEANFDKSFSNQVYDANFTYNVPYAISYCGICYRKDKMPKNLNLILSLNSWNIFNNELLKGNISFLDDIREVLGAALKYLGYSCNTESKEEIDEAVELVLKWRNNVRKFDSESYRSEIPGGFLHLAMGYSCDAIQLILGDEENGAEARNDIGFFLPKEGFTISCDEMVILKDTQKADLAYKFINYLYEPEVAKKNIEYIYAIEPVKKALDELDDDLKNMLVLTDEQAKVGERVKSFDGKPEVNELYNKAWDRIKSMERK